MKTQKQHLKPLIETKHRTHRLSLMEVQEKLGLFRQLGKPPQLALQPIKDEKNKPLGYL